MRINDCVSVSLHRIDATIHSAVANALPYKQTAAKNRKTRSSD